MPDTNAAAWQKIWLCPTKTEAADRQVADPSVVPIQSRGAGIVARRSQTARC